MLRSILHHIYLLSHVRWGLSQRAAKVFEHRLLLLPSAPLSVILVTTQKHYFNFYLI